ncbi:porin [Paraburkholderia aspalathi]|uniref:porin n=1 Tax=Paraburkholderia aspalathi TaxID=1324617 RepID=UPI001FCA19F4|nr:porin [Paraburkholderia aspalathi]
MAKAQSSVTLYGIVDAGVSYINNVGVATAAGAAGRPVRYLNSSRFAFNSGGDYGNRWGLTGKEDLGGALSAVFRLENGFNIGTGALKSTGIQFNRQAFFGLSSTSYGSLTFGRQYEAITDLVEAYGPAFVGGIGTYAGDVSNFDNSIRVNNSVKYRTPLYGGFSGELLYGIGGAPGSLNTNSTLSAGVNYVQGPIAAGIAYLRLDNSGATTNAWSGSADGNFGSSVTAGYAGARRVQIATAAANYTIGAVTLAVNYGYTGYQPSVYSSFKRSVSYNSAGVGARYVVSPALTFGGSATYTIGQSVADGASRPRYQNAGLAAWYNVSKRTGFYVYGGYQHASGSTLDAYGNVVAATASIGDAANGLSSGSGNQVMVNIGMFNKF